MLPIFNYRGRRVRETASPTVLPEYGTGDLFGVLHFTENRKRILVGIDYGAGIMPFPPASRG